jgi:hypothetical protein
MVSGVPRMAPNIYGRYQKVMEGSKTSGKFQNNLSLRVKAFSHLGKLNRERTIF